MSTKTKDVEGLEPEDDETRRHYRVRLGRLVDGSRPFADLPEGPKSAIAEERARERE
jgi:hypothetical protein